MDISSSVKTLSGRNEEERGGRMGEEAEKGRWIGCGLKGILTSVTATSKNL